MPKLCYITGKKETNMIFSTLSGILAGRHEISGCLVREDGTVLRRIGSSYTYRWSPGRVCNRQGHLAVFSRKVMKNFYVHRLVAEVFIPNPEHKPMVGHINRNPRNNAVSNLRWVTKSENFRNSDKHDRSKAKYGVTPCEDRLEYGRVKYRMDREKYKERNRK